MTTHLPDQLKTLVHEVSQLWGDIIREEAGPQLFSKVEGLRSYLKTFRRKSSLNENIKSIQKLRSKMDRLSPQELSRVTHAFSILLELTNICENAVRSHKIRQRPQSSLIKPRNEIYLVLTAHPTESRAPEMVDTLHEIQKIISTSVFENDLSLSKKLKPMLRRVWHLRMAKQEKPEVRDEAKYLYSILFKPETIDKLLGPEGDQVFLRTWVGGDKDGHPGVDEHVMLSCLQGSRQQILSVYFRLIHDLEKELQGYRLLSGGDLAENSTQAYRKLQQLRKYLSQLVRIQDKDARRIERFKKSFIAFEKVISQDLRRSLISLEKMQRLLRMFPSLVIPLELREDSQVFRDLKNLKQKPAILRMLIKLQKLSDGLDPRGYARALIISMCEELSDLKAAEFFQKKAFGKKPKFPIVPLFEKSKDLANGPVIAEAWIRARKLKKFEVMLGYSDSSKEAGVLPSRIAIRKAIEQFESLRRRFPDLRLTYFHGSGGSVARGGGSIENQTAHWPQAAFDRYKVTLQGEMIQRTFSTPEILNQYISKVRMMASKKKSAQVSKTSPVLISFAEEISHFYRQTVSDPSFLEMVEKASAYRFLEELRIGSRPSKRKKLEGVSSLRAIPWILAWTQTRNLLPTWWGFGTAFEHMNLKAKKELQRLSRGNDPLMTSYIQQLGFTLAKIEPAIWFLYLEESALSVAEKQKFYRDFLQELKRTQKAFRYLTGKSDVMWFKPWLKESIKLRAPLIHPLNMAQLKAWKSGNSGLLREASVGIACGMLTTG